MPEGRRPIASLARRSPGRACDPRNDVSRLGLARRSGRRLVPEVTGTVTGYVVSDHSPFSAADPALGYLFQCRYALLGALRRLRHTDEFLISIETLDDVVFDLPGRPLEVIQTKHHLRHAANLSDASVELWKSLRIWCEGNRDGTIPPGTLHYLITTTGASPGSAAALLRFDG